MISHPPRHDTAQFPSEIGTGALKGVAPNHIAYRIDFVLSTEREPDHCMLRGVPEAEGEQSWLSVTWLQVGPVRSSTISVRSVPHALGKSGLVIFRRNAPASAAPGPTASFPVTERAM